MKTRTQLIRAASRKNFTASQWRKRMEAWMDMLPRVTFPTLTPARVRGNGMKISVTF